LLKNGGYVLPVWGTNNCLRFGTNSTGNIKGKGGNYHNKCLMMADERAATSNTKLDISPINLYRNISLFLCIFLIHSFFR